MANPDKKSEGDAQVLERDKVETRKPSLYKVILLNDDYTTMDFVVSILEGIFQKTPTEAVRIMLQVHNAGKGVAGTYPKEIAEAKITLVHQQAKAEGYPLSCDLEKA